MASFRTSYICPFCDLNFVASNTLQDHIGECGNSLIICAECGMAIQRRTILNHQNSCPVFLKKQIKYLLDKDVSETNKLKTESIQLQHQLQLSEQRNHVFTTALHTIKLKLEDHHSLFCDQQNLIQELCNSISKIEEQFESLKNIIDQDRINHSHLELIVNSQDSKIRSFHKLDSEIIDLRDTIEDQNKNVNEELKQIDTKLNDLKEEINSINNLRKQQEDDKEYQNKIDEKFTQIEDEISKIKLLKYDSKDMKSQIQEQLLKICETNEKMNIMENKISFIDSKIPTTFYSNLAENNLTSKSGHLIWRIDDFENKMKESVENKTALFSPKFYSHEYGYALQAEVHLNGLGRWRGRNITASVFFINGDYDPILPWPVSLHADIILKDQTPNRQEAIDATKSLVIKRKETSIIERRSGTFSLESSKSGQTLDENIRRQYVFIPHTSLDKLDYIKNDVIFIEVLIKK